MKSLIRSLIPRAIRRFIFSFLTDYWSARYIDAPNDDEVKRLYPEQYRRWLKVRMILVRKGKRFSGDPDMQQFRYFIYNVKVRHSVFNPHL